MPRRRKPKLPPLVRGEPVEVTHDRRGASVERGHPVTIEERPSRLAPGHTLPALVGRVVDLWRDPMGRTLVLVREEVSGGFYCVEAAHVVYRWKPTKAEQDSALADDRAAGERLLAKTA